MHSDDEISPEAYAALADKITRESAQEFREAIGSPEMKKLACCRYLKRGALVGLSHPELIDFLGVSSPSVLDLAGYSDEEAQAVMDGLAHISDADIARTVI